MKLNPYTEVKVSSHQAYFEYALSGKSLDAITYELPEMKYALAAWINDNRINDPIGLLILSYCHINDYIKPSNKVLAYTYLNTLTNSNNPQVYHLLGVCYQFGYGTKADLDVAIKYYLKAISHNYAISAYLLYYIFIESNEPLKAVDYLIKAANLEDPVSMLLLADIYMDQKSIVHNYENSFYWYNKAYRIDNLYVSSNLAVFYEEGICVIKNIHTALIFYRIASNHGDIKATYKLGDLLNQIEDTKQEAITYIEKAADSGYLPAIHLLTTILLDPESIHNDFTIGYRLAYKYALNNEPQAMFNLFYYYVHGLDTIPNFEKAKYWLLKAKENGLKNADVYLNLYFD